MDNSQGATGPEAEVLFAADAVTRSVLSLVMACALGIQVRAVAFCPFATCLFDGRRDLLFWCAGVVVPTDPLHAAAIASCASAARGLVPLPAIPLWL